MPFLNNNNYNDNILKKLKELINCENDLEISNNKYKKLFKENNKYLIYFKNLLSNLNLYSYEDDVVLDPFCGSGTTAIAAKQNNRNYICYDINREYIELSKKRITNQKFINNVE